MESGELECSLCAMEGVHAVGRGLPVRSEESEAWDGLSYPSRRRHRVGRPSAETYELLLAVVLRSEEPEELRLGKTSRPRSVGAAARLAPSASPVALELARDLAGPAGERAVTRWEATL
jgi:hypothetical protein